MSSTFDTRSHFLAEAIETSWEPEIQAQHWAIRLGILKELEDQYGSAELSQKVADYVALGTEPFSVMAFHNHFSRHARAAFVSGAYYAGLTAAGALGERILNHLLLTLRDSFKLTAEYKDVYSKQSFDNWSLAIDTLESWKVLLPEVAKDFRGLKKHRDDAIHFRPKVDKDPRSPALEALRLLGRIIDGQFGALVPKPWYMDASPGETFVKKDAEHEPFVAKILLTSPSAHHVGPKHVVQFNAETGGWDLADAGDVGLEKGSDQDFLSLRRSP